MNQKLSERLGVLLERQNKVEFWCRLAICWALAALFGLVLLVIQRAAGWSSWTALPVVVLAALVLVAWRLSGAPRSQNVPREMAHQVELQFPELNGRLITAVQQEPSGESGKLNFLQERLVQEVLAHAAQQDWSRGLSSGRVAAARALHWVALASLALVLAQLRVGFDRRFLVAREDSMITVSPGDVSLERGSSLVVLARFSGLLPPLVELVVGETGHSTRVPLAKSLADPMFGGTLSEVTSNLSYHVEYGGHTTRDFKVSVFEYPRLQRADIDLTSPEYTGEPTRHIEDTRRVSAVEGSFLDLSLHLNKPVVSARLVPKKSNRPALILSVDTNAPLAALRQLLLEAGETYDLQLMDRDGRTNKAPAQFVFEATKNRTPELRLASPRGDLRPTALEEVPFEGSVWDDFGVVGYGIGYSVAGRPAQFLSLGERVPGKEKRQFNYLLRLEELQVKPDELVSWFLWADDLGPDGKVRRTVGDLFFGEIRPFDEAFKEGQGDGQGQGQGSGSGEQNQTTKLTELQKQIIGATWNLQRREKAPASSTGAPKPTAPVRPLPESRLSPRTHLPLLTMGRHLPFVMGQPQEDPSNNDPIVAARRPDPKAVGSSEDLAVIEQSQAEALQQAEAAAERARDPRAQALWSAAIRQMEQAVANLRRVTNSAGELRDALGAEQAAYQALLKLQEHDYQVSRQRNRSQSGGSRQQQMDRQLEQMDLTQSEDRYENQRQAQAPENSQHREQLQVMNRLQELARRQRDLNERLKELQTALQEAQTEQERAELQRRLKRLQEEEQQMLNDVDELRQRMDRPENQSRMADEKRQLDQTRQDVQRAAEAASQGAASQALASGTRAERQFQQLRDQLRKENSSQFAEELRSMRGQARELAQHQQEIQRAVQEKDAAEHKSLADPADHQDVVDQLNRQKQLMTNLVDSATRISQEAETSEPLLSSQLYDTVRKFTQDSAKSVQQTQEELLGRGLMPGNLLETLKSQVEPDGAKLLDVQAEMLRRGFTPQASQAGEQAAARIQDLKEGLERAAESVLGNDTEALRLAQQELDQLTAQLQAEMAQTNLSSASANGAETAAGGISPPGTSQGQNSSATPTNNSSRETPPGEASSPSASSAKPSLAESRGEQQGSGNNGLPQGSEGVQDGEGRVRPSGNQARSSGNGQRSADDAGNNAAGGEERFNSGAQLGAGGGGSWNFDRLLNEQTRQRSGPITGEDFLTWSDRLREVEEIVEMPELRNEVASARERARLLRQEFKRDRKKPDWAVVRTQVMGPLTQVRDRIADELARRNSGQSLVPLDRDPVPSRYSDLVRRYYEELGKDK